jgi:hypothetical protein
LVLFQHSNTILNFFGFLFLKIDRSGLHIKTLSLSFDVALLAQPVKDSPCVTILNPVFFARVSLSTPFLLLLIIARTVSLGDTLVGFLAIPFFAALALGLFAAYALSSFLTCFITFSQSSVSAPSGPLPRIADPSSRLSSPSPSFEFNPTQHYCLVRVIQDICPGLPISDCNIIIINTQPVARCRSCCSSISIGVPATSVILV